MEKSDRLFINSLGMFTFINRQGEMRLRHFIPIEEFFTILDDDLYYIGENPYG